MSVSLANIPVLLQTPPNKLVDVRVFGAFEHLLPSAPSFLAHLSLDKDCQYATVRTNLIQLDGNIYQTNGRLLIVTIPEIFEAYKDYYITVGGGSPRQGMTIKHQVWGDTYSNTNIAGLVFRKGTNDEWIISQNAVVPRLYIPHDPSDPTKPHPRISLSFPPEGSHTIFPFDCFREDVYSSDSDRSAGMVSSLPLPDFTAPSHLLMQFSPEPNPEITVPSHKLRELTPTPHTSTYDTEGNVQSVFLQYYDTPTTPESVAKPTDEDTLDISSLPMTLVNEPQPRIDLNDTYTEVISNLSEFLEDQQQAFEDTFPAPTPPQGYSLEENISDYLPILTSLFNRLDSGKQKAFMEWCIENKNFLNLISDESEFVSESLLTDPLTALQSFTSDKTTLRAILSWGAKQSHLVSLETLESYHVSPYVAELRSTSPSVNQAHQFYWLFKSISDEFHTPEPEVSEAALKTLILHQGYFKSDTSSTYVSFNDANFASPAPNTNLVPMYVPYLPNVTPDKAFLEDSPCFLTVEDCYCPLSVFNAEFKAFQRLVEASHRTTRVDEGTLSEIRKSFESSRGFQLSDEQFSGVSLTKYHAAVLSGSAGSGKTTTSDCMTEVLEACGYSPLFVAPTGKAAKRLSEVVGRPVKTLHSFFRIPVGSIPPIDTTLPLTFSELSSDSLPRGSAIICDEMAMADSWVFSLAINSAFDANPDILCYFLGDIKQLPPIGKGMPYRDLMRILPTVELGVSRRAAAGSKVNFNCSALINGSPVGSGHSLSGQVISFQQDDDFHLLPCTDKEIVPVIKDLLEGINSLEDVQIVTPYVKNSLTRPWASSSFNPVLQDIFNPLGHPLFTVYEQEYRLNDKIIHNQNDSDMTLVTFEDGRFRLALDEDDNPLKGIVNGEVGVISDFFPADSNLLSEVRSDLFPNESRNSHVVLVSSSVEDASGAPTFYAYTGTTRSSDNPDIPVFISSSFSKVSLAYAISVHKSQGSQYPIVIFPLSSKDSPSFVNRNLIYTAISRAQKQVYMVGSVSPESSTLNTNRLTAETGDSVVTGMSSLMNLLGYSS